MENRKIKSGEFKKFLIAKFDEDLQDFRFWKYQNRTYFFKKEKYYGEYLISEVFYICYSSVENSGTDCGIYSIFDINLIMQSQYNSSVLNKHISLIRLKTESLLVEDSYYFHNGQLNNVIEMINQITYDFRKYGMNYIKQRFDNLKTNELLNYGLNYIENLKTDKTDLRQDINEELKNSGYSISRLKNKIYINLKENLQRIPNQQREEKQQIPKLALEFLNFYIQKKNG